MKKISIGLAAIILLVFAMHAIAQTETDGKYFISFDTAKIYYEVKGTGHPVILIHGFSGTGQGWKKCAVYDDLLNAGYQVILIDQRAMAIQINPTTKWPMRMTPKRKTLWASSAILK